MKRVEELVRLVRVFIGEQLSQRLVTSIVFRYLVSQGRHARRDRHGPQEMGPLRSECHTRNVPPVGPDDITLRHLAGRQGLFVARGRSTGRLRAGRTPYTVRSLRRDGAERRLPGGGVPPSLSGSRGRRRPAQNGCRPEEVTAALDQTEGRLRVLPKDHPERDALHRSLERSAPAGQVAVEPRHADVCDGTRGVAPDDRTGSSASLPGPRAVTSAELPS